jgi:ferredoxin-nitrite reductase
MHDMALIGTEYAGRLGFAMRIGGGLSTAPRIAKDLEIFVEPHEAVEVLRALIDVWKEDRRYRVSRAKARFKFMVDDYGPEWLRELLEERLGRKLPRCPAPVSIGYTDHLGVHPQRQEGLSYIGFPVPIGWINGRQMQQVADLAASFHGEIRLTRQQNFILANVPNERIEEVVERVAEIGFPLNVNRLRGSAIACTGEPFCNFAVGETKHRLKEVVAHLESVFGRAVEGLRLQLDGCPHSCGQHWLGDIGVQATTARERAEDGSKLQAYDIYLRGGIGARAAIGFPLIRRVPAEMLHIYIERLYRAYLHERANGHPEGDFQDFCNRHTNEELFAFSGAPPEHFGQRNPAAEPGAGRARATAATASAAENE